MKIRQGFVSNSSSSSFIIAFTEGKKCKHCGHVSNAFDFLDRLESMDDYNDSVRARGRETSIGYVKDNWGSDMEETIKKIQDSKKDIAIISLSYHNESLRHEFNELKENGTVEVLYSDNE